MDSAKTWNLIKGMLGWKTSGPPTKLFCNGRMLTRPIDIAEKMNHFFVDKVKSIVESLPVCNENAVDLTKFLVRDRKCCFGFNPFTPIQLAENSEYEIL